VHVLFLKNRRQEKNAIYQKGFWDLIDQNGKMVRGDWTIST